MENFRKYGPRRPEVVLVHGGPGAGGEMASLAGMLEANRSILEPLQTATTLRGQVDELKAVIQAQADLPAILVGFSWGAWLAFITASYYPALVKKLILIGSGPFEEKYAARIEEIRLRRLSEEDKTELKALTAKLMDPAIVDKNRVMSRYGKIFSKADAFDPMEIKAESIDFRPDILSSVWPEGAALRKSGRLLNLGRRLECPVAAIHGDYDPHPAEGVAIPLSGILRSFSFFLIKNCGHKPWAERQAGEEFLRILEKELTRL